MLLVLSQIPLAYDLRKRVTYYKIEQRGGESSLDPERILHRWPDKGLQQVAHQVLVMRRADTGQRLCAGEV